MARYGHEVARLAEAQSLAKDGYDVARRGGTAPAVQQDIKVMFINPDAPDFLAGTKNITLVSSRHCSEEYRSGGAG